MCTSYYARFSFRSYLYMAQGLQKCRCPSVKCGNIEFNMAAILDPFSISSRNLFFTNFSFSTSLYCKNGADLSFHEKKGFKMHSLGDKMVKSVQIVYLESLLLTLNMFLTFSWCFYC